VTRPPHRAALGRRGTTSFRLCWRAARTTRACGATLTGRALARARLLFANGPLLVFLGRAPTRTNTFASDHSHGRHAPGPFGFASMKCRCAGEGAGVGLHESGGCRRKNAFWGLVVSAHRGVGGRAMTLLRRTPVRAAGMLAVTFLGVVVCASASLSAIALGQGTAFAATGGPSTNLLLNGCFTDPALGKSGSYTDLTPGSTGIPNWTVGGDGAQAVGTYWPKSPGCPGSLWLADDSPGFVSQSVPTTPGDQYLLRWEIGGPGEVEHPNALHVLWGGSTVAVQSPGTTPWQPGQVTVTATQASTTVEFSATFSAGGDGPTIGSASLTPMSPEVSGNQAAISYFRLVSQATSRMGAQELTLVGVETIKDDVSGPAGSYGWSVSLDEPGGAPVQSGYVPAIEQVTVAAKAGLITWASNLDVPSGCPSASAATCTRKNDNITFLYLLTNAGVFTHPVHPDLCWSSSGASLDSGDFSPLNNTGGPSGYPLDGDYLSLRQAGGTVVVTSTYRVGDGQTATETDTVDAATHLPVSTLIHVAATAGHPGYTQRWVNRWLTTAPAEPRLGTLCTS